MICKMNVDQNQREELHKKSLLRQPDSHRQCNSNVQMQRHPQNDKVRKLILFDIGNDITWELHLVMIDLTVVCWSFYTWSCISIIKLLVFQQDNRFLGQINVLPRYQSFSQHVQRLHEVAPEFMQLHPQFSFTSSSINLLAAQTTLSVNSHQTLKGSFLRQTDNFGQSLV